jgi:hypothetical protein
MIGKFTSSKIPVRDLKPIFDAMERQNNRSRKETFSASFNAPDQQQSAAAVQRLKSVEKGQKSSEKNKELKQLVSSRNKSSFIMSSVKPQNIFIDTTRYH